jgi:hypothetical protein
MGHFPAYGLHARSPEIDFVISDGNSRLWRSHRHSLSTSPNVWPVRIVGNKKNFP